MNSGIHITIMNHFWIIYESFLSITSHLVGGLEHEFYDFPYIGNFIIPTDFHSIIFERGRVETTNQITINHH